MRQPRLLLLLLVGPVLIMAAFGLTLDVRSIVLPRALVVVDPGSEGLRLFERFREEFAYHTSYLETTDDPEAAENRLSRGEVDAVIPRPPGDGWRGGAGGPGGHLQYDKPHLRNDSPRALLPPGRGPQPEYIADDH